MDSQRLIRRAALLLAPLLWILAVEATAVQLPLKSYTTVDGLASDRVACILKDSHGFLWLGTWDGISRFDSYRFQSLATAEGLPGPAVNALLESRDGTYWAATNGGLARWNPARAPRPPGSPFERMPLPSVPDADSVESLLQDRAGALWIGTGAGLYRAAGTGAPWSPRPVLLPAPDGAPPGVSALFEEDDGAIWIGAESGLYRRDSSGSIARIAGNDGKPTDVRSLAHDRAGRVWAGTHTEGLYVARISGGVWTAIRRSTARDGLAGDYVFSLLRASDGTIWAGCYGGLSEFPPAAQESGRPRSYTRADGLAEFGVFSLAEDGEGDLWIGTDNGGLQRLTQGGFRTYGAREGLASPRTVSLVPTREGGICSYAGGPSPADARTDTGRILQCFDGARFHALSPRVRPGTRFGWGWSQVTLQDRHGEWWIPTFHGLYRFPAVPFPRLASTRPLRVYTTADGLPSDEIFRLYEDRRGDLWLSLSTSPWRLARWDRATDSFERFSAADGLPANDSPISFAEDRSGALWIGFYGGGLACRAGDRFSFFTSGEGVPAGRVRALHLDRAGRLWVGASRGGIARLDRPDLTPPRFVRYTTAENLSSDNVWSLADDAWGRIYVGTERGLDRLDPSTATVETFTPDDGLVRGVIEEIGEDRSGALWFGSIQGVSRLVPRREEKRPGPSVRIAAVWCGGKRERLPELGGGAVTLRDLSPDAGPLQIEYLGLDLAPRGRLRYQYRLDGDDGGWSRPVADRSVIYASLRPGRHLFEVRAVRNDGAVSPREAVVAFRILPPLWERPGFLGIVAAAALLLGWIAHRARLRSALAIERVRTRIATDLHDDVGSSLTQIAILSEIARQEPDDAMPKVRQTLSRIASVSRDVVDSLGDTVWAIDPRKDRLQDLIQRMRRFAGDLLVERQIDLLFEVSNDGDHRELPLDLRRNLYLIFKEAIHNIARHSGCTRAEIELRIEKGALLLRLADNGKGFNSPTEPGYGIASIRSRAAGLGGTVRVDSRPCAGPGDPSGTRIELTIPLPK